MKTRLLVALSLAIFMGVAAGCAKVPQDQVESARASLEAARTAGAGDYAPEAMATADQAMAALDEEVKAQEGKFALFRSYGKTKELAAAAKSAGDAATTAAQDGKAQARDAAMTAIADAKATAENVRGMLDKAVMGKGSEADIEAMKQDLAAIMVSLGEADSAFAAESYLDAKAKADVAKSSAQSIEAALNQAREMRGQR